MSFRPLHDRVLVRRIDARREDGRRHQGDEVLFGKWSGTEVKIDGEDLLIMKESDILGVVEATKAAKKAA